MSCSAARCACTVELDERPDGLADLADARRVAAVADLGVDELEDLALTGGERCGFGHGGDGNTIMRSGQTPVRNFSLHLLTRTGVRAHGSERPFGPDARGTDGRDAREPPGITVTPRGSLDRPRHGRATTARRARSDEERDGRHHDHDPTRAADRQDPRRPPRRPAVAAGGPGRRHSRCHLLAPAPRRRRAGDRRSCS